ncbi:MAG: glycosyltransferase family 39 protein, partial [Rhodomicrobium sp.]
MVLASGRPSTFVFTPGRDEKDIDAGLLLGLAGIGILIILRTILAASTDLAEDEAYYWLWSTHLAAGYYDHPPMIAYWIRAGTAIFGDTSIGVRFVGLLSAIAGSYLIYLASLSLFRERYAALLAVIWMNATIFCNAAAIVATPDTPLAFFTTLAFFTFAKLIETGKGAWWFAAGASLGLAFDSKYTAVLLLPGLLLWGLGCEEGRRWLRRPHPYLGAIIAITFISPVVYWNYTHDWVSFAKQAGHGIKDKPSNAILSVAELFGSQAGLATPLIFAFCLFGGFYSVIRGFKRGDARWLLTGSMTVPVFAFFFIHAASQKIQANWPGFIYPVAIVAAVNAFSAVAKEKRLPRLARPSFSLAPWVGMAFTLTVFAQLGLHALPIEAKKDPTSRLRGWAKLGADVDRLRQDYGASAVLTDRYAMTGELAFYARKSTPVIQINERIRYSNLPAPSDEEIANGPALFITRKGGNTASVSLYFENVRAVSTIQRAGGFHSRDAYDVHLLTGYRGGLFGHSEKP